MLEKAISAQSKHIFELRKRVSFYRDLRQKGIVTVQEKNELENEYHNSSTQLNMYKISLSRAQGDRLELFGELARSDSLENQDVIEIQREINILQQQVINSAAEVEFHIVAPVNGEITSMAIFEGQSITKGKVAVVIVPDNARPLVEIWLPQSALQDVKLGAYVLMRIESLPWERFGKVKGAIISISGSPETLTDNSRCFRVLIAPHAGTQYMPTGVEVKADILTTHRYIWEWIFSPIKKV